MLQRKKQRGNVRERHVSSSKALSKVGRGHEVGKTGEEKEKSTSACSYQRERASRAVREDGRGVGGV